MSAWQYDEWDPWVDNLGHGPNPFDAEAPFLIARTGSAGFSLSTQLEPLQQWCWDVNGWYRTLGVPWPYANVSVGQLSRYYLACGGQNDARKTYVFKKLLNKQTRQDYHTVPLGSLYLDDELAQEFIRKQAKKEAQARKEEGELGITPEDILDEWNMRVDFDEFVPPMEEHEKEELVDIGHHLVNDVWAWSYWVWDAHRDTQDNHEALLRQWQSDLITVARELGYEGNIQIGVHNKTDEEYIIVDSETPPIAYINEDVKDPLPHAIQVIISVINNTESSQHHV